jgi:hypothetical protein
VADDRKESLLSTILLSGFWISEGCQGIIDKRLALDGVEDEG